MSGCRASPPRPGLCGWRGFTFLPALLDLLVILLLALAPLVPDGPSSRVGGIYERREGETLEAYNAARCYFELREERSQELVAQRCTKGVSIIERWCAKWDW